MIDLIKVWFSKAVPNPTDKNRAVQYGVHLEEVLESLEMEKTVDSDTIHCLTLEADFFKQKANGLLITDHELFLDSLCDQIVTAVGVAHMMGYDISGALQEVNRSNWSKFVNGEPVFDENGKIKKGENYTPPDLTKYVKPIQI